MNAAKKTGRIKIYMSERAPVSIEMSEWSLIASADAFGNISGGPAAIHVQANQEWYIHVRQHQDGRRVVYGENIRGNGGMPASWKPSHGGFLIDADEKSQAETVRAIRRVAGIVGNVYLADECIAELPADKL